jgi:cytosine/adenosine deaminase-related metal-dependent hydrolase
VDDQIAAAAELGMRFAVSRGSMSVGPSKGGLPPDSCVENEDAIMADCERVIARFHNPRPGSMCQIVLAPCSPFSVSETLLRQSALLARAQAVRLHTHLCETGDEERYTRAHFGKRPVGYMEGLGWTGPDVWFAHGVHMNAAEIGLMSRSKTCVCHCPSSNMRLGSGIAPIRAYRDAGVGVALGVDGSASNDGGCLLGEARQAMLLSRVQAANPRHWLKAREVLEMATLGGAAALGRQDIGALEAGRQCDFFSIGLEVPAYAGAMADPVAALVFCAPQKAREVVVGGRIVVREGRITAMEMAPVVRAHNRCARALLG